MASLRVAAKTDRLKAVVALQPVADLSAYVEATRTYAPTRYEALCRGMGAQAVELLVSGLRLGLALGRDMA